MFTKIKFNHDMIFTLANCLFLQCAKSRYSRKMAIPTRRELDNLIVGLKRTFKDREIKALLNKGELKILTIDFPEQWPQLVTRESHRYLSFKPHTRVAKKFISRVLTIAYCSPDKVGTSINLLKAELGVAKENTISQQVDKLIAGDARVIVLGNDFYQVNHDGLVELLRRLNVRCNENNLIGIEYETGIDFKPPMLVHVHEHNDTLYLSHVNGLITAKGK